MHMRAPEAGQQLRSVLEAHRLINSDLSLDAVLGRIVRCACDIVGSGTGALGVVDPDGSLDRLVHHGVEDEVLERVAGEPTAAGLRRALLGDSPRTVRPLRAAGTDGLEYLCVPIRARDEVYGDLYVARPAGGFLEVGALNGEHVGSDDRDLLAALAATAATAIANARLYEDAQRTRDWLHASGEIARGLLADHDRDLLGSVACRTVSVARADFGALVVPTDDGRALRIVVPAGIGADAFDGAVFAPEEFEFGRSVVLGEGALIADLSAGSLDERVHRFGFGSTMLAPLVDSKGVRGSLVLVRLAGRPGFTTRDLELATMFGDQVALALELNDVRAQAEQLSILEMRHRIAQDMHDNLIQRLFATGMGLQVLAEQIQPEDVAARMHRHIDELDETIDQVRERVFGLRELPSSTPRSATTRFAHLPDPTDLSA